MKRLTRRWGEQPYPNLAGKVVCEYKECDSARSCENCIHGRYKDRLAAIEDILCDSVGDDDPDAVDEYDLDRLAVMCNQRMSMRDEVSERFSLTAKIPLDRLREVAEAEREGRCVVLPCKRDDVLWTFHTYPSKRVYSFHVTDISTLNGRTMLNTDIIGVVDARDVGKAAFLTRAEAEAALKAREQDG